MTAPATNKRWSTTTVTVDVEIGTSELEDAGYHHDDDCPAKEQPETDTDRQRLSDWRDTTHGLTLWANCPYEPCNHLTDDFRSSR